MMQHFLSSPTVDTTKRFCQRIKAECVSLRQHIHGIPTEAERIRYAIVLLMRIMVLYFLQEQGFLDGNPHYLNSLLDHTHNHYGSDSFYRQALLPLLHALVSPEVLHHAQAKEANIVGKVPSLPIHLFAPHPLELTHTHINIDDAAFTRLFAMCDEYEWSLHKNGDRGENILYPAALADVFESHADQKQTGSYYTQEDVTTYIAENTIVLHLFEEVRHCHATAFAPANTIWRMLQLHPDRYIRTALRTPNPLPLETEQEYRMRCTRYEQLHHLLCAGMICSLDDLITFNLDIMRFALDTIEHCQQEGMLRTIYEKLLHITILDPTCGTGALLSGAFKVLQRLHHACARHIQAMANPGFQYIDCSPPGIKSHIVAHNLYGVDLIEEAADVCAARLLLNALADIDPSTDLSFSRALRHTIRHGNAIAGHTRTAPLPDNSAGSIEDDAAGPSTQHFDWDSAYPEVMREGGFDVIIGNPPYIEYSKVRADNQGAGNELQSWGNLYATVLDHALTLCKADSSHLGFIVPLSICGSERFARLRTLLTSSMTHMWLANFEIFPSRLFPGAYQRLSILLAACHQGQSCLIDVTKIQRWYALEREHLIEQIQYTRVRHSIIPDALPKLASPLQDSLLHKVWRGAKGDTIAIHLQPGHTSFFVYYQEATNYWTKALCHVPFYKKNGRVMQPPHGRFLYFQDAMTAQLIMALMNSSLFYVWFATYSDGFHLAHALVKDFPLARDLSDLAPLAALSQQLSHSMALHARRSTRNTRQGTQAPQHTHLIELEEYRMRNSKPVLDAIDGILAQYYGFSDEEYTFIVNYDSKYRMGDSDGDRRKK